MNSEMGLSSKLRRLMALVKRVRDDRRGACHWAHLRRKIHMREAPSRAAPSGTVQGRHFPTCCSVCRIRGSSPFVGCGFDARRTSHSVAVHRAAGTTIPHSGGHRAREGGSTLYFGISQPLFATARPPGSNAADQASWNRDNDSAFPDASDWLRDSTRRNLAMGDISPEGDEQFAGERYD